MTCSWKSLPYPTPKGQVGGHEGVGKVVKLGQGAEKILKVGDRVGIKWMAGTCGNCGESVNFTLLAICQKINEIPRLTPVVMYSGMLRRSRC